jgi:DNA-binding response OmpR family regulator/transcription antitermination factor NusG
MRALLSNSDPQARDQIANALRRAGHEVLAVGDGLRAVQCWQTTKPDIVLLGLRMPVFDAEVVCRRIRQEAPTPVLVLNGHASRQEVAQALAAGADAYVPEPYRTGLLLAHIEAALERTRGSSQEEQTDEVRVADLILNSHTCTVTRGGRSIHLTPLEFGLLELLVRNANRLVPYSQLISHTWGDAGATPDLLKTHIYHLRKKLDLAEQLRSTPGIGYRLVAPARPSPIPHPVDPNLPRHPGAPALGPTGPGGTAGVATRELRWVVLKTRPWHERQVEQAIAAHGVEAYVPVASNGERDGASAVLFPGYVFARVDVAAGDLLRIRSAAGVAYVLPQGGPPGLLPNELIEAIRTRASEPGVGLHRGDRVRIMRGPFRWLEAVFDRRTNPAGRVRILLEFVQRTVTLDIDERDLRRAGRAPA